VIAQPRELFKSQKRSGHGRGTAVSARIPEPLLQRLAAYGNSEGLMLSDCVRAVLEIGLDHADCPR
jgi:hypothetical protein